MKNILKNSIQWMYLLATAVFAGACSEWTDPESLKLEQSDATTQNPEVYARYLVNLREYKVSDHKIVFGWYDHVELAASRADHLTQIPDSVDIISLMRPDNLPDWVVAEKNVIREQKGTRCVYTISLRELITAWKQQQEDAAQNPIFEEGEPEAAETFAEFSARYMDAAFSLCEKYDYDGVVVEYEGKSTIMMTAEELATYTAEQNAIMGKVKTWKSANKSRMLIFEGTPQYVLDKELLRECAYILLPTREMISLESVVKQLQMAVVDGVPVDRLVVEVQTTSLDPKYPAVGYFGSEHALTKAAYWVAAPSMGYTKAGLAVYNLQNDYYNQNQVYQDTREAICIMNPSAKN